MKCVTIIYRVLKKSFIFYFIGSFPFLTSCSLFISGKQNTSIAASHPDADIYVDNNYLGKGQIHTRLIKSESHVITAKRGNQFNMLSLDSRFSTTGMIDLIFGCIWLVSFIGLASDGAYRLNTDTVYLKLD